MGFILCFVAFEWTKPTSLLILWYNNLQVNSAHSRNFSIHPHLYFDNGINFNDFVIVMHKIVCDKSLEMHRLTLNYSLLPKGSTKTNYFILCHFMCVLEIGSHEIWTNHKFLNSFTIQSHLHTQYMGYTSAFILLFVIQLRVEG